MDIVKLIGTLPLLWKIIMVSIIILINSIYLFRKQISKSKLFVNLLTIFNIKKLILKEHKLFQEETYLMYRISLINLDNHKKTEVFKDLLIMKYKSIISFSKILIHTKDIYDLSNKQLYAIIINNMVEIVDDYNSKIKLKYGEQIYELIMNHPEKGFNIVHQKTVEFIKNALDETLDSQHVKYTNADKIDFLFDLYYIAMKLAISDIEKVYNNFNGELFALLK